MLICHLVLLSSREIGAAILATGYFTHGNFTHEISPMDISTTNKFTTLSISPLCLFHHPVRFTTMSNFTALSISHLQKMKLKNTLPV
jgi:hypothetical protein